MPEVDQARRTLLDNWTKANALDSGFCSAAPE
jgi:hypothetical protein